MSNVFAALSHTLSRPLTPSTSPFTHLHPSHHHHHHQACRMSLPAAVRPRNARCALSCSLGLQMSACSLSGHTHSLFHPPSFTPSLFHTHTPSNTPPHPLTHPLYPPLSLASTCQYPLSHTLNTLSNTPSPLPPLSLACQHRHPSTARSDVLGASDPHQQGPVLPPPGGGGGAGATIQAAQRSEMVRHPTF